MASLPPRPSVPQPVPVPVPYVLALADDLSGAAETACALGGPVRLSLAADVAGSPAAHDLVVDLDTRHLPAAAAAGAVCTALR
ncbi:four-carbon acid sugar kinase family protein, partial [Streptomyces sp. NPDC004685]